MAELSYFLLELIALLIPGLSTVLDRLAYWTDLDNWKIQRLLDKINSNFFFKCDP